MGRHPSTISGHNEDPDNPIYGECLFRNQISLLWNDYLHHKCKKNDMKFISVIRNLINDDGLTNMEYFRDYCHLNQNLIPMVLEQSKTEGVIV